MLNSSDRLVDSEETATPAIADEGLLTSRFRIGALCLMTLIGLIEAVYGRHSIQDDGVSYLDMGDAIVRGDWKMAVNGHWSPLYPWLQGLALRLFKPGAYSQFSVVHFVNFLIYLFALGCFDFLLRVAVADRPRMDDAANGTSRLPRWAVFAVGYSVFLWSAVGVVTIRVVGPEILMAGFLYLAVGLLLQTSDRRQSFSRFVLLGAVLGLGYLAKAPMFPLAFVFFAAAWILAGGWKRATPHVLAAVLAFLAVSGPWITTLSRAKGRFMFGDSARYNYVLFLDGAGPAGYFQNLGIATGRFTHPVRQIFDSPPVYEFATPIKGTLPVWDDPSYWSDGAVPRFSLRRQLSVTGDWLAFYFDLLFTSQTALFVGFIVLGFMGGRDLFFKQVMARWPVWLIGLAGLGMYALVHVELRYIAAFVTLFWVGLFSGLEIPRGRESRRLAFLVTLTVVIAVASPVAESLVDHTKRIFRGQPHNHWRVAEDLRRLGVMPGDRVGRLPTHFGLGWARLLRVTVVAQIPIENSENFWCAKPEVQERVIETIRRVGVTAIVAEQIPPNGVCAPGPEWHKVGDGTYYALKLEPGAK
jgi:4-amino-4-deoxy-L-arabinose transferase-like glycosyltransferase